MKKLSVATVLLSVVAMSYLLVSSQSVSHPSFVNWETPHVHPLDITPDELTLLVVNTADNRLEVFDVSGRTPVNIGSVPVGLDPVSVRARTNTEVWVVNHISDSISVVDLTTLNVVATLRTEDEPADVVFAGTPQRAFVSAAQASKVMVFDPAHLLKKPIVLDIDGEEPRAMAVSPDGSKVYVAIFESGNRTTIIGHAGAVEGSNRFNPVNAGGGPYGGQNPPPNAGVDFNPPQNPDNPPPSPQSLIVKKNGLGQWLDDNNGDWTAFVSGGILARRPIGWDLLDNDVAIIDTATLGITYLTGLMNLNMALAVRPWDGQVSVVGTDATNEIRFEPNLKGRFLRVNLATADPMTPTAAPLVVDLNPHLDYSDGQVAAQSDPATASQALRDQSVGDPRAIVWDGERRLGFVTGMGSNNVLVIGSTGARVSIIPVGEGPTGAVLQASRGRLFVLNKFDGSISVVDTGASRELSRIAFFDPTPGPIKLGRKHLYDAHRTSALGHIACASCHVDSRLDRLAWDLGDPTGEMKVANQNCNAGLFTTGCPDWHPMKGPMTTQTLQNIIGNEPHHWRGDRDGLEEFSGAFTGLQGDDVELTATEMQEFEDFLSTIFFPPNPFRNPDNSLPTDLALVGHFSLGEFGLPQGAQLLNGNAVRGLDGFRTRAAHSSGGIQSRTCVSCHTLPSGMGTDSRFQGDTTTFPAPGSGQYFLIPVGPLGEHHLQVTGLRLGGTLLKTFKIPQLRNLYKRVGFERNLTLSRAGFGFFNAGSESLADFMHEFIQFPASDQEVSDVVAFLMSFAGSDLPAADPANLLEPPGPPSQDTHAAVGIQLTVNVQNRTRASVIARLAEMTALADTGKVGLVAKGRRAGVQRGWVYLGGGVFQSDRLVQTTTTDALHTSSGGGTETTFTVVPKGTEVRIGVDRDGNGVFDGDQGAQALATGHISSFGSGSRGVPVSGGSSPPRMKGH